MTKRPAHDDLGSSRKFTTYSNLAHEQNKSSRAIRRERRSRAKAEYLATLPKNPIKRFFTHFSPKRVFKYWFSLDGLKMIGKIFGGTFAVIAIILVVSFFYFRGELKSLQPSELNKRVQTTVTKYYDRNNQLLWEDKGSGEYRLVVDSDKISKYIKDATVAIEDKNFYKHGGVSISGTLRAIVNNIFKKSRNTQGGSTLTQQLIKQVFFADQANNRGITGIPRKIKEAILAFEAENIYSKDQILTMYLNESPYGGRRNGVESAAQTYFGKSAKDLTIDEAALLASIPQSPAWYNPYNTRGNNALLARQKTVISYMAEQGMITDKEAEAAKKVSTLDKLKPLAQQFAGAKAPHFIQMVKNELTEKLGAKIVGQGGLIVKTTLDSHVQDKLEDTTRSLFSGKLSYLQRRYDFDNSSMAMIDNQTGQLLGVQGSRDYNYPGYGAVNSATSFIQPGSSIKPLVYASLINNQNNNNGTFGGGSIIPDTPIPQNIYRTTSGNSVNNADGKFKGNIPIRKSLGGSRNVPAIKAMALNGGAAPTWQTIREAGDQSYCTDGADRNSGLASAIGGCGVKQVEHINAFATIARGGVYKPYTTVLEVKNGQREKLYEWKDSTKQVFDPQTTYIISDILSDDNARKDAFGWRPTGFYFKNIKTATKTGTSNIGNKPKDIWMMSFTPKATLSVWAGNHTPSALRNNADGMSLGPVIADITQDIYDYFKKNGMYKENEWFNRPKGIQDLTIDGVHDLYPSWYNKAQKTTSTQKMVFDRVSKKRAGECTPEGAKETIEVTKITDTLINKSTISAPDGYDADSIDDFHKCDDNKPFISEITLTPRSSSDGKNYVVISVIAMRGTNPITGASMTINGKNYDARLSGGSWDVTLEKGDTNSYNVNATVSDAGFYTTSLSRTLNSN